MSLFDIADEEKSIKTLKKIATEEYSTDWGVRSNSSKSIMYSPGNLGWYSYQHGKVWPLITGWCTVAEFKNHMVKEAMRNLKSFAILTEIDFPGVIPETVRGDRIEATDCYHQLWSSAMFLFSVIYGIFGMVPNSFDNELSFTVHLPEEISSIALSNLRFVDNSIDISVVRKKGIDVRLSSEKPVKINLSVAFDAREVWIDGEKVEFTKWYEECQHTNISLEVKRRCEVRLR